MARAKPRYPAVKVRIDGDVDENAFSILHKCGIGARDEGIPEETIAEFMAEATSADYGHLVKTCREWFSVRKQKEPDR